jgi:hypothetical protein
MRTTERQSREGEPTIDDMRYDLAEQEAINMSLSEIIEFLLNGYEGLHSFSNIEIKEEWEELFGESK